jgi:hypothetical protein
MVNPTTISKIESINEYFKLPIHYLTNKTILKESVSSDLELTKTADPSNCSPIYHFAFNPKTKCGEKVVEQVSDCYTTNTIFLKETQELLKTYQTTDKSSSLTEMIELWDEIKNDTGFKEKYCYMDWSFLEFLNKSDSFLQISSMYNLASPVISFLIPIFILIIPFFIIKAKGLDVTMNEYVDVLKIIASNHAIGKIFTQFNQVSTEQKAYLIVSAAFYIFSIYQNVLTCMKFYKNMHKIYNSLKNVKQYLSHTHNSMQYFLSRTEKYKTYSQFNEKTRQYQKVLVEFKCKLNDITGEKLSIMNMKEVGLLMKYFYELHENQDYNDAFMYSFGFHGYVDMLNGISQNIKENKLSFAQFDDSLSKKKQKSKKTKCLKIGFKDAYYGPLIHKDHVKNNLNLDKTITITGPNASGKTTILKSALINILFSQQFGCGFYKSAVLKPYKHIHCYLNIPDTSGRDSLFQAEARRCKEIIDCIQENKEDLHFCMFDELYSGTNPEEAVSSALGFMKYLNKFKNVTCLLTTHFIEVCKILGKEKIVSNFHMNTVKTGDNFTYTYLLKKGISEVRGGMKVLQDLNYPEEIVGKGSYRDV